MSAVIEIRPARPGDAVAVAELVAQLGYPAAPERVEAFLAAVAGDPRHTVLVASEPGRAIAGLLVISCRPALRVDGWIGTVEELVVRQGARARGIGSRLLQHAKGLAAERGWKRVEASVARRRESYRRGFLLARGFVVAETIAFRWAALEGRSPSWPDLGDEARGLRKLG